MTSPAYSPKEKPYFTLPTVKKPLEQKRRCETSSVPPSCCTASTSSVPTTAVTEIKSSKTVLHLAVKEGDVDLVRYLLSIPQMNMKYFVNLKAYGHTALHMAAGLHGNPHQGEILRLLLSSGADPGIRNLENNQPAHLLQSGLQGERLKLMLKKRSASSRRRGVSLQDQEYLDINMNHL